MINWFKRKEIASTEQKPEDLPNQAETEAVVDVDAEQLKADNLQEEIIELEVAKSALEIQMEVSAMIEKLPEEEKQQFNVVQEEVETMGSMTERITKVARNKIAIAVGVMACTFMALGSASKAEADSRSTDRIIERLIDHTASVVNNSIDKSERIQSAEIRKAEREKVAAERRAEKEALAETHKAEALVREALRNEREAQRNSQRMIEQAIRTGQPVTITITDAEGKIQTVDIKTAESRRDELKKYITDLQQQKRAIELQNKIDKINKQ